ncbi:MAG: YfhO family protein, partial [Ruminiclostridium sp.]|nr:YfhO family protein [Ruminiclostridium sp.]
GESDGFAVFETQHFIPMAFTFDTYIRDRAYDQIRHHSNMSTSVGDRLLVKDLILTDEQADTYGHLLKEDTEMPNTAMSIETFNTYADERAASAASSFTTDPGGYTATITLPKENLVFFSIPYDRGFKAYVDGKLTAVECVDYGFMAVPVPAGTHEVRLAWSPWGIEVGIALSILAAIALVILHIGSSRVREQQAE